jgi:alpha-tubulin suppressor-like RCC1 family protein
MTVAVIGVRQGSATITAASASAKATAVVTVTPAVPVGSVNVTPAVDTLVLLDVPNVQLTATVRDSTDRLIGRQVTWTSDNAAVASVDANGLVTAAGPGKATIAATSEGVSGHADVSVLPAPPVASVTIVPESATVIVLDQPYVRLTATLRDSGGRAIVRPISWVSDNGSVATVDVNGLVTAVSPGRVAITATSEVVSDTATVTVLPPAPVASVRIGPDSARLVAQGTQQFAVTISDASGRTLTGRSVGWTSDNGAVASVDANGLVTGLAPGSASVTATSEGVSDTAAITVIVVQFSTVSAGNAFTCGLTTGGDAYCWGWELGVGNNVVHTFPAAVRGGIKFTALTSGRYGACGVTAAGAAYCWGQNSRWPTEPVAGGLTFASLNRGVEHTCGVTSSGAAYCWGLNLVGDLGNGDTSHVLVAVPVRVSGGLTFASVSVGEYHSCGLTTQGAAYCWGDNGWRQLGDGTTISSAVPVAVFGGLRFTALDAGLRHTCAVSTGGTIYCWGSGGFGELGSGTTNSSAVPIPVFGSNVYTSVNAGDDVSCGITNSGRADCWGLNGFGQLGTGSSTGPQQCSGYPCSTTPVSVVGNLTFSELSVGDGEGHTCGRTSSGVVYCWGGNRYGQLGNGTTTDSKVPVRVLGQP